MVFSLSLAAYCTATNGSMAFKDSPGDIPSGLCPLEESLCRLKRFTKFSVWER